MLYSKNGSIPKPEMSGDKEGWVEIEEPPVAPEGKEVVWWFPPGWVVRDLKPADTETTEWSWSQSEERWVEYDKSVQEVVVLDTLDSTHTAPSMATASEIIIDVETTAQPVVKLD
jgi:hypothetical protein